MLSVNSRPAQLIHRVCALAGSSSFLVDIQNQVRAAGIRQAIQEHDTEVIFDWLLTQFSFQGISDQVARSYIRDHGSVSWQDISTALAQTPPCPRLGSYWRYSGCRFDKSSFSCAEPEHIDCCPVPRHPLRNGRLNQTAYSFFLFVRDVAKQDLVGWIDNRLAEEPGALPQERIIGPLRSVFGISDKILTMTLSVFFMGSGRRHRWFDVGKDMIAIDSLVHNFLHRTGILEDCEAEHGYGVGCYAAGGCADIVRCFSSVIDAREFNPKFPRYFPRFVQHAIWRYCALDGQNVCNGNRIDDRKSCEISFCGLSDICAKKRLKGQ